MQMTDYTYTVIWLLSHLDLRRQYYWRTELTPDFVPLVAVPRLEEMGDDRLYIYCHTVTVSSGFVSSVLLKNWMTERVNILRYFCITDKSISLLFLKHILYLFVYTEPSKEGVVMLRRCCRDRTTSLLLQYYSTLEYELSYDSSNIHLLACCIEIR